MTTLVVTKRVQIDPANPTGTLPTQIRDFSWTVTGTGIVAGTYWNGDVWIYLPSGTLTVDAVTPAKTGSGATTFSGSQKNPRGNATAQGLDGAGEIYPAAFDTGLTAAIPGLTMVAGDTLITALSRVNNDDYRLWDGGLNNFGGRRPGQVDTAAVLYVVGAVPAADAFAPNWGGDPATRQSVTFSQVQQGMLPTLILPPGNASPPFNSELIFWLNSLWLDMIQGWNSLYTEGHDCATTYSQARANILAMSLCKCFFDQGTVSQQTLLKHVIQHGIHYWGLQRDGKRHDPNGGHAQGRKAAVVFAGTLLGDPLMAAPMGPLVQTNTGTGAAPTGHWFQEDIAHYIDSSLGGGNNWKGGPGCWRYNINGFTDNQAAFIAAQTTGYQHLNPSLWGNGAPLASAAIHFHEGNSYYPANHEEKVGQALAMLALRGIEKWDGTISHSRGGVRTVTTTSGSPADINYSASKAFFCDMVRFMSPHVAEIDSALVTAGITFQQQGNSTSWSLLEPHNTERKRWIRDLWCANYFQFLATNWIGAGSARGVMGPEVPSATSRGALDRPLLTTIDKAVAGATVTFHIWSGLTASALPPNVTITATLLEAGYPLDIPLAATSGGRSYYFWYTGTASAGGIVPFGIEGGSGAALGETALSNPDALNGYVTTSVVLPSTPGTSQTWYCYQVVFLLSNGEKRTTNALLCQI